VNVTALVCCILDVIGKYRSCLFSVGSGAPYRATRRTGRVSRGHAVTLSVVSGQLGQRQRRGRTPLIVLDAWISPALRSVGARLHTNTRNIFPTAINGLRVKQDAELPCRDMHIVIDSF